MKILDSISLIPAEAPMHCLGQLYQVGDTYVFVPRTLGGQPIWSEDPFPATSPGLFLTHEGKALVLPGAWIIASDDCYLNRAAAAAIERTVQ